MIKGKFFIIFSFYILFNNNLLSKTNIQIQIDGTCTELQRFTDKQKEIIFYAYYYGKEHGLGYLMAAIAWKESCAGEYLINFSDPSAGIYHNHIPSVIKKYTKYKDSSFLRNVVGQMLIANPTFASSVTLDNLFYWDKIHKGNLEKVIKSYNRGFAWQKSRLANKSATAYYNDVANKMRELQTYIPLNIGKYKLKTPYLQSLEGNNLIK